MFEDGQFVARLNTKQISADGDAVSIRFLMGFVDATQDTPPHITACAPSSYCKVFHSECEFEICQGVACELHNDCAQHSEEVKRVRH